MNETTTERAWRRLRRIRLTDKEFLPSTELASIISANGTEGRKMGFYYWKSASVGLLCLTDTRRLPMKNLVPRGIKTDFSPEHTDTFRRDLHPDLSADYVLANPPFNDSDWFRKDDDVRWQFGIPPCSSQSPTVKWND